MNEFSIRASIRPKALNIILYNEIIVRSNHRYILKLLQLQIHCANFYTEYQLSDNTQLSLGLGYEDAKDFYDGYLLNFRAKHSFNSNYH